MSVYGIVKPLLNNPRPQLDLLLFTLNAGYVHPAMGLWYLRANLSSQFLGIEDSGAARGPRTAAPYTVELLEYTRRDGQEYVIGEILTRRPRVLAVSVSIWNHTDLIPVLKTVRSRLPETTIVVGGPEVSHLPLDHPTFGLVDGVVRGEAELVFSQIVEELLEGAVVPSGATVWGSGTVRGSAAVRDSAAVHGTAAVGNRTSEEGALGSTPWVYDAPLPDLAEVVTPHHLFSDHDVIHRFMYLEASRGCPFRCQFCLSSLSTGIRHAPLEHLFETADALLERGATRFKFIDRTFNLDYARAAKVLEFWLGRVRPGISVQFETVPDRFPRELRALIRRFPEGTLRLEVGIQTFNPTVAQAINRYADQAETIETLDFLAEQTDATVHADLIVGLPEETFESFAAGFDRLYRYAPGEVQIGILKRLPGAPISIHDGTIRYNSAPPYDVVETDWTSESNIARLKRFAKYWELVVNRGRFPERVSVLLGGSDAAYRGRHSSPFYRFLVFSDYAWDRFDRTWGITPEELAHAIDTFIDRGAIIKEF